MASYDETMRDLWRRSRAGDQAASAELREMLRVSGAVSDLGAALERILFADGFTEVDVKVEPGEALETLAGVARQAANGGPWDVVLRRPTPFRAAYKWGHVALGTKVLVLLVVRDGTDLTLGVGVARVGRAEVVQPKEAPGLVWPELGRWPEPGDPWESRRAFGERLEKWARTSASDRVRADLQLVLAWAEGLNGREHVGVLRNGADEVRRDLERRAEAGDADAALELFLEKRAAGEATTRDDLVRALERWPDLELAGVIARIGVGAGDREYTIMARVGAGYVGDGESAGGKWWGRGHPDERRLLPGILSAHDDTKPFAPWLVVAEPGASLEIRRRIDALVASYPPTPPPTAKGRRRRRNS